MTKPTFSALSVGMLLIAALTPATFTPATFTPATFTKAARAAEPTLSITLAGQAMLRADLRVVSPATMAAVAPLMTGDVRFTNFEATVGQPFGTMIAVEGDIAVPKVAEAAPAK
jgi:hypothetical protein